MLYYIYYEIVQIA